MKLIQKTSFTSLLDAKQEECGDTHTDLRTKEESGEVIEAKTK